MDKVPLSKPCIDEEDVAGVVDVLRSGWISLGPKIREFEKKFAQYIGTKYALAVNSGTSGLHLCMQAINVNEGDEVITTPLSFVASANCILYQHAKPVFVDVEEDTWNINPEKISEKITAKTKALLVVHLFSQPCSIQPIMELTEGKNLKIIEDACEVIGAEYKGKKAGRFGKASVFSFYPNKQMTTGEGGMIVTNDERIAKLCDSLRNQGREEVVRGDNWLSHDKLGYNYRLDEMSCALGITQLKKIDFFVDKRNKVVEYYAKRLKDIEGVSMQKISPNTTRTSWFVFVVRAEEGINRNEVIKKLGEKGIPSRPYFPAIHTQPLYRKMFGYKEGDFPVCEAIAKSTFALPFFTEMSEEQVDSVCRALQEVISEVSRR
jgi:perosamine synthetase